LSYTVSSTKTLLSSLVLSALAALAVCGLWSTGLIANLQSLFLLKPENSGPYIPVQSLFAVLMIFAAGMCAGFLVERAGLHRALFFVGVMLFLGLGISLLASRFFQLDIAFAPVALSALLAMFFVQVKRLWVLDKDLSHSIQQLALQTNTLEGGEANTRLVSGLRLLETVLPLEEAVIFQPDEEGNLAPAARLRQTTSQMTTPQRNIEWREGVKLCEKAVEERELHFEPARAGGTNVAVPLRHAGRSVGALLVRLREPFDESDRPLLAAVGAQIARSFQRNETRKREWAKDFINFISVRAAQHRFDAFGVISGLLTEQRFGSQVVAETSDGQAIAYLDGTIASINQPMLRFARMPEESAKATDLFGLLERFRSEYFDEPALLVRRVLQTGEPYERDVPYPEYSQTLSIRVALAKVETNEGEVTTLQPVCLTVTVRDITGLQEYKKLKSDTVSLISHELRTPITSINGFSELLSLEDDIPESAREYVAIISNEAQRLSRMIDTFLSVTKLEQKDKEEVIKVPVKLDEIVKDVLLNMQHLARSRRIRLFEQSTGRIPPVAADRGLITKVITNLVDNAIRYSPERTNVIVSTTLEIDYVRVTVEDQGYGIPPESLDKVWEKFYRVAREGMDKEEKSTGLGLTFVKEVIEQHGGGVSVMSEVGKGSVFSIALPRL
jgi:signal transduction histidine kinase